jgi:hypothetical protein
MRRKLYKEESRAKKFHPALHHQCIGMKESVAPSFSLRNDRLSMGPGSPKIVVGSLCLLSFRYAIFIHRVDRLHLQSPEVSNAGRSIVWACVHKSAGCEHCYAEQLAKRYGRGRPFKAENINTLMPFMDQKELRHMLTYKPRVAIDVSLAI